MSSTKLFNKIALIGIGLIGSSIAHAVKKNGLAASVSVGDVRQDHCDKALELGCCDQASTNLALAVKDADLVLLCVPIGANAEVAEKIAAHLKPGAIVSDVGSVKQAVVRDVGPLLPEGVHLVPGHPIAGTEFSGPEAGFAELFQGRWCILTPPSGTAEEATAKVTALWRGMGSMIEIMDPSHHDMVLAITSHLPHLIAYTIVGTASNLEESLKGEVIRYSASGFRDFTRIAASDPIMWRDVFLNNRDAVLEMLQRFSEDLTALQRAIRWGEGQVLEDLFTRTRAIRRGIIEAKQDS
ncbi:MAG: prephenate/arogenate dehydrogenase family protein [Alphaproteobacteria bacterium]|nr:prephenate/arogenate dehydrogenase family protein [Alphaproteobacteria bacterium]